jgi:hypothetical protein
MRAILTKITLLSLGVLSVISFGMHSYVLSDAQELQNRFDQMVTSTAGAVAYHTIGFTMTDDTDELGSIRIQFCSNDPLPDFPCTAPVGFDDSGANLLVQTGNNTGFSIDGPDSTSNELILSRGQSIPTANASTYQLGNIVNPSVAGTYYIRLYTYPTSNGSGPETQHGGIAIVINNNFTVSAEVPPYLKFCAATSITDFDCSTATNFFVNMGNLSTTQTSTGSSQFVAATNAQGGYSVTVSGTTLTSGNNIIPSMTSTGASKPGLSQFGINLRTNSSPSVGLDPIGPGVATITGPYDSPNQFTYNDGDILASSTGTTDNLDYTVSYIANVSPSQAAGVYTTTVSYICLANF